MSNDANLFTANLEFLSIEDVQSFCELDLPMDQRPKEGQRIDYKLDFPKDLGKDISAMGNASGGLLILGVEEEQGIPNRMPGIDLGKSDVKTRVINIAHSTIDPPLIPEVGFCTLSDNSSRCVVVIRTPISLIAPHMYIKEQDNRVYIRVGDKTVKADLRAIEMLFHRKDAALEESEARVSAEWDRVGLDNFESGFRALAIIPEISLQEPIQFNAEIDSFIERTKPADLVWVSAVRLERDKIILKDKAEKAPFGHSEQYFSVSNNGVVHFSETLWDFEKGIQLDQTIEVVKVILTFAKGFLNHFGYFGRVHVFYRFGRVKDKPLTSRNTTIPSPISFGLKQARDDDFYVNRLIALDADLEREIACIIKDLCRAYFGFNLVDGQIQNVFDNLKK